MFNFLPAVCFVEEEDVTAASPDVGADGGEGHGGWDDFALAVEIEVFLWFERGCCWFFAAWFRGRFYAFGYVG